MKYETAHALRMALEQRLLTRSQATGVALDRLRRRVLFERVVIRLQAAEPGRWVLKGGMALEVRLEHGMLRIVGDRENTRSTRAGSRPRCATCGTNATGLRHHLRSQRFRQAGPHVTNVSRKSTT